MKTRKKMLDFSKLPFPIGNLFKKEEPLSGSDIFEILEKQYQDRTRLITTISVIGILLFITVATLLPFRDRLFNILYQKPPSQAATINLVQNGGFEAGDLRFWNYTGAQSTHFAHSGSYAAQIQSGQLSQNLVLKTGKNYTVTAWIYLSTSGSNKGRPTMLIQNQAIDLQNQATPNQWRQINLNFKAATSQATVIFAMEGSWSGNFIIDDVQVSENPSP